MRRLVTAACLLAAGAVGLARADDPAVVTSLPGERLEKILTGLEIKFKKTPGKADGVWFYEFTRQDRPVRLHNYGGQDLWIDSVFADPLTPADVNRWNARTRYSRAVLLRKGDKATVSLEAQIDCLGGVTDALVRQFVTRFDGELTQFVAFTKK